MLEMLFKRSGARRERWLSENSHGGKICTTYAGCESQSQLELALVETCEHRKKASLYLCFHGYIFHRQVKM